MPAGRTFVVLVALLLAACGGSDGEVQQPSEAPTAASSEASTTPTDSASGPTDADAQADGGDTSTYTVESGDTLSEIANRFGTTVQAIARANNIADPDAIDVGQELTIPQ